MFELEQELVQRAVNKGYYTCDACGIRCVGRADPGDDESYEYDLPDGWCEVDVQGVDLTTSTFHFHIDCLWAHGPDVCNKMKNAQR